MRQLETGPPVGIPVSIRFSGEDIPTLRAFAGQAKEILRATPKATRVRDNWGEVFQPAIDQHVRLTVIAVAIGFAISFVLALVTYRL